MPARGFFGIDIGTYTSKIVQMSREGQGFRLITFGQISTPKGLFSESEVDVQSTVESIKKLLSEKKVETNSVTASLPENKVFTRTITLSSLTDKELSSAIRWQAEQYIPLPISEVSLRYSVVDRYPTPQGERMDILLVAAPLTVVNKYMDALKKIGLNPVAIETEPVAISRVIDSTEVSSAILLDLGATDSTISVLKKNRVFFTRTIATGGDAFTRAIASEFNIQPEQAREYKSAYGMLEDQAQGKVVAALRPVVGVIIEEIDRTIALHQNKVANDPLKRLILVGGTALMPGLAAYMASNLNMDVEIADAWSHVVNRQDIPPEAAALSPEYATAAGLAMMDLK